MIDRITEIGKEIELLELEKFEALKDFIRDVHSPVVMKVLKDLDIHVRDDCEYVVFTYTKTEEENYKSEYADVMLHGKNLRCLGMIEVWNRYHPSLGNKELHRRLESVLSEKNGNSIGNEYSELIEKLKWII